jgi:hypothetical protein
MIEAGFQSGRGQGIASRLRQIVVAVLWRSPFLTAVIVSLLVLPFFLAPLHSWNIGPAGDTVPAELMPIAILHNHSVDFNEILAQYPSQRDSNHLPYWLTLQYGRVVSFYPLVPGLMNLPVYLVADEKGYDLYRYRYILSHITSSLICALATGFMFLSLDAICARRRVAIAFAFIFALGTEVWSEASRGMWQHGPSILLLTAALAIIVRKWSRGIPLAGVLLGLAIWNRPTNVLIVAPLALYVVLTYRRQIASFVCAMAVPLLFMAIYSYMYLGSVMYLGQGRSMVDDISSPGGYLRGRFSAGLAGLLFSPNRGLLVFDPIFAAGLAFLIYATFSRREWSLYRYMLAGVILTLWVYGHWLVWWGGYCFGYRLISELTPLLILATAMAWERWVSRLWMTRRLFVAATLFSIYVHGLGAFYAYFSQFNFNPNSIDQNTARLWDIKQGETARDQSLLLTDLHTIFSGHLPPVDIPKPTNN